MKLVFATHNPDKLKEIQSLLPGTISLLSLSDIGCTEDIPETEQTLEGNALLKAAHVYTQYGYDCFADDTGLQVEILDGAPGVHSARYAGKPGDSGANIEKLLRELRGVQNRNAYFETVIALHSRDKIKIFSGISEGEITMERSGYAGFGYDPVFRPRGYEATFAELPLSVKNTISHRGKAFNKLLHYLRTRAQDEP
jgi:XTP/dITP diphosphohydrolase